MKCKYNNAVCDFDKPEEVRDDCRSFGCTPYLEEEVVTLKDKLTKYEKIMKENGKVITRQQDKLHRRNALVTDLRGRTAKGQATFESGKALKFTEEDVFKEGCLPETAQSWEVDIKFSAKSIKELISQIKSHYDVTDEDILLNACDEKGRIDISVLEDESSQQAAKTDMALWKQGKKKLWNSIYTYNVAKVIKETVKL